jgi:hypothetical protein
MRGLASPGGRQLLPKSLMQRLTLLASGQLSPLVRATPGKPRRQGAPLGTLVCFGIGAMMSSVLGGVTLLGLRALNAAEARMHAAGSVAPGTVDGVVPPAVSGWEAAPEIVEVAIERSERARTALSLRLQGAEDADLKVVVRGVPAEARLSKGERRDAATWVVKRADLDGLRLTLGEAGPDAFDIDIDVLAPSGVAAQAGVVRVRVVDTPAQQHAAAGTTDGRSLDKTGDKTGRGETQAKTPRPPGRASPSSLPPSRPTRTGRLQPRPERKSPMAQEPRLRPGSGPRAPAASAPSRATRSGSCGGASRRPGRRSSEVSDRRV